MDLELCISQRPSSLPASNDKLHFSQRHTASWRDFLRALLFARCWQIFSPTWELRSGLPLRVTIAGGDTCCGIGTLALSSLRKGTGKLLRLLFGHLAATRDGIILPLNAGIPKWLGIWLNDKTGHFVISCLLAHKLKNEN